jgi:hypothetical protein
MTIHNSTEPGDGECATPNASSGMHNLDRHELSEASFTGPGYLPTSSMIQPPLWPEEETKEKK